jgi:hypothetical protein
LPTIVATLPTFAPIATASRNGTGSRPIASAASITSGVRSRQTVSFTNSAESAPDSPTTSTSSVRGACDQRRACPPSHRKKPASRRWAITIIIPNRSARVWKSIAAIASRGVRTPNPTMAVAPTSVAPVRSRRRGRSDPKLRTR